MPKKQGKHDKPNSQSQASDSGQSIPSSKKSNSTQSLKSYRTLGYVESSENIAIATKDQRVNPVRVDSPAEEIEIEYDPTIRSKAIVNLEKEIAHFENPPKMRISKTYTARARSKILKNFKASIQTPSHTHTKELPKQRGMSLWAVSYTLINLCFYISDIMKDIIHWRLIYEIRLQSETYTFGAYFAIFFLAFAILVSNITSLLIYWKNGLGTIDKVSDPDMATHYPILKSARIIFHVLLMGNAFRSIETIVVGIYSLEKRSFEERTKWSLIFLERRRTTSIVYLIEALLRSWPLALINLILIVVGNNQLLFRSTYTLSFEVYYTIGIILSSTAYLSINIVSYNECHHELRRFQKRIVKLMGVFCQFIWRFMTINARLFAITMGLSSQLGLTLGIITEHWLIVTIIMFNRGRAKQLEKGGREHETRTKHLLIILYDLLRGVPRTIVFLRPSIIFDDRIKLFHFWIGLEDLFCLLFYLRKSLLFYTETPALLIPSFFIYYSLFITGMLAMNLFYLTLKAKIVGHDLIPSSKSEYILDKLEESGTSTPEYQEDPEELKKRRVRERLLSTDTDYTSSRIILHN